MNKPFSILYEDFKINLANLINNSGLPASVIELVLQNYLSDVKLIALKQYQQDKIDYERSLADESEK